MWIKNRIFSKCLLPLMKNSKIHIVYINREVLVPGLFIAFKAIVAEVIHFLANLSESCDKRFTHCKLFSRRECDCSSICFGKNSWRNYIFTYCPTEYKESVPPPPPPPFEPWCSGGETVACGVGRTHFGRLVRNPGALYPKIPVRTARTVLENAGKY